MSIQQYTDFAITWNTHIVPTSDDEVQYLKSVLLGALRKLSDRALLERLFPCDGALTRVEFTNVGMEIGPKNKQFHVHFSISILHTGKVTIAHVNRDMQQWLDNELPWERPVYVRAVLLNSRAKNYNLKAERGHADLPTQMRMARPVRAQAEVPVRGGAGDDDRGDAR